MMSDEGGFLADEAQSPYLGQELSGYFDQDRLFQQACEIEGEVFREVESRRTLKFNRGGTAYFVKLHFGVGWKEIFKDLLQLRLPILGAKNEWQAARVLSSLGIDTLTPVAYVSQGLNPAHIQSCIITRSLEDTLSLEEMAEQGLLNYELRQFFVTKLADIARKMHNNGINHRDFYICHFLVNQHSLKTRQPLVHLIDLHRAQIRAKTPARWRIKDLSGLLYSGIDAGLSRNDIYRFIRVYTGKNLREGLQGEPLFWRKVLKRATNLYRKDHGRQSEALNALAEIVS